MDTGIRYSHVEFGGRARAGYDAYGGTGADCHGHGTHVAGTVGGATYGVAKQVALVSVRVLDCTGSGSWSGFVAGADWISRNATPGRAVMNASIGGPISSSADAAVQALVVKGIVPVVAAGNNAASACNYSPARAAGAITVGATTSSDARASYSNFGSCVDWFAPGSSIVSASYSSNTGRDHEERDVDGFAARLPAPLLCIWNSIRSRPFSRSAMHCLPPQPKAW